MIDRFIFEASQSSAASRVVRSEHPATVAPRVFEGLALISSTLALCRRRIGQQLRDPQQTVAAEGEGRHERDARQSAYPHLAQCPAILAPAEDLFDALAQALTGQIAAMAARACIDRAAARMLHVLRHVGRYAQLLASSDEAAGVLLLICSHRSPAAPRPLALEQRECRLAFGKATRLGDLHVYRQPLAVLHQHVPM